MARPSKIHTTVKATNPETDQIEDIPITDAICRLLKLGVYPSNAAGAHGIAPTTLTNWQDRGAAALANAAEHSEPGTEVSWEDCPEAEQPYARFLEQATRAEIAGLVWHEVNVRKAAASGKEQGGRLSLEFLSRRERKVYGKSVDVKHGGKITHEFDEELDDQISGLMDALVEAKTPSTAG